MPSPRSAYNAAVLEARRHGFRLTHQTELLVQQAFRDAANAIQFDLGSTAESLTNARASFLREQILGILDELQLRAARTTQTGVTTTIREVTQIHEQVVRKLLAQEGIAAGLGMDAGLARLNTRVALTLAARRPASNMLTLVNRHIEEAAPALDRLLVSGIAQGVSVRTLTADVADLLATAEGASLATYELDDSAVTGLRTLWSDAQRIARSETLNALRESNAAAMDESPIVLAIQFGLSGNHPLEDECDGLAEFDGWGYGGGWYPPSEFPLAPHSNCGCSAVNTMLRPVDEWGTPKDPAGSPDLEDFDPTDLIAGASEWSANRIERARVTMLGALSDSAGRATRRVA